MTKIERDSLKIGDQVIYQQEETTGIVGGFKLHLPVVYWSDACHSTTLTVDALKHFSIPS